MPKRKFFIFDCSKAENCCDKSQYNEAGTREKISMLFHLLFCGPCRKYTSRNTKLTRLIKKSKLKTCSEEEKKAWKNRIEKEIAKKES
ncbi:glycine dehydrogenase [Salegentibacter salinarum]|uniref:Glycine dehydrogenase n=1 Tax=Salegentibacter salinarum TaxID=447422 RepID=A0A2N0TP09_9FLAO|nr:hypothetical protein [Salegentibacter salinarum]PKD16477.1 glycine dehydrogenase [Salegentibacter salinarum]SKB64699.1 hypothetical protein SAMN05660903_01841 [Salegentibacter salinarum]